MTLAVEHSIGGWAAEAHLDDPRWGYMVEMIEVQPPGVSRERRWPDSQQAMAALEAALAGTLEAESMAVTRTVITPAGEVRTTWDWATGCWQEAM